MKMVATPVTKKTDNVGKVSGKTIYQNSLIPNAPSSCPASIISGEISNILFAYIKTDVPKLTYKLKNKI